ncbi:DUF4861 family protein [Paraflavisolibacter sp. H34]|uniref:DUF4861 family protein n=1 Tax=Huijunlia imazamoxiresistens TaxID=3127457 RepID=UPI003019E74A
MKKSLIRGLLAAACIQGAYAQAPIAPKEVFTQTQKVADWQLKVLQASKEWKYPSTDWTNAAYYTGEMAWARLSRESKHLQFLKQVGEDNHWKGGPERFFADDYCIGQTYAELFQLFRDSAMIREMMAIGNDLIARPHTESLEWNFAGGLHNREWAWCDALYMGPPMLACLATATGERRYLDIANKLWWRTADYLYDPSEQLFFRDSRFFTQKEKNGRKVFWGRGNGWVIAATTRMLDNMQANYPDRPKYEKLFGQLARRLAALQQPDGTWHASLLDPASYPVKETSGTAFFVYAFSWGVNHGLLDYATYFPVIRKGWEALNACVHPDGKLGFVQVPGAAPEKVTFEDTEVYGVGAYLLAGTELYRMMVQREKAPLKVEARNPTALDRAEELIELPIAKIRAAGVDPRKAVVIDVRTGKELPSQLVYKGAKAPRALVFPGGLGGGGRAWFFIEAREHEAYRPRTFGRLVPERKDDFAWENDKVAFRMYGPALQASGEVSSGIDVWAKRTRELVINRWYQADDYHKDQGEGLDFYGVGKTLGAGGIAPLVQNQLAPSQNFISCKVLDNGPLRTTFQLHYAPWKAGGHTISEVKTITLDAGSYLNKVEVAYKTKAASLPVAVGIAQLPGQGAPWSDVVGKESGLLAYRHPADPAHGVLMAGAIVPGACTPRQLPLAEADHYQHTGHAVLTTTYTKDRPFTYFQGAAWDKEGGIQSFESWQLYLQQKRAALQQPLLVTLLN